MNRAEIGGLAHRLGVLEEGGSPGVLLGGPLASTPLRLRSRALCMKLPLAMLLGLEHESRVCN